jgi:Fe-S-cluster containining protein
MNAAFAELEQVYDALQREVAAAGVACDLRGHCCDFARSGHVLFATDVEVAYARAHGGDPVPDAAAGQCPWFRGGRCHLRAGRPLGCRVYFCDPRYADKMNEIAERHHRRVVEIHRTHGLSYRYSMFVHTIREEVPCTGS